MLALLFRTNLPVAISLIWVSNPLTFPPIFLFSYKIGVWLLNQEAIPFTIQLSWDWAVAQGEAIWLPLLTGSLLCGLISGGIGYVVIHRLWRWKVVKNWEVRNKAREEKSARER
jgi:uncharacterized protein (DUF2062 family)